MNDKIEKLIERLEDDQAAEFKHNGKSGYFTFLEDVIMETKELYTRWEEINEQD